MQPWRAPVPLTRVWCIFEAYAAEATRSRFSVAMTEREAGDLVGAICANPSALLGTLRALALLLVLGCLLRPGLVIASAVPQRNVLAVVQPKG